MENRGINSSSGKKLQIRYKGHCIICLKKVGFQQNEKSDSNEYFRDNFEYGVSAPEIVPKSVTPTAGFLATFNQIWGFLDTKWREKNTPKKDGKGLTSEDIGISLENVLQIACGSEHVSFSSSPTICQYCCDKVVAVKNLMKAVKQQVREINLVFEKGRRIQGRGSGEFEKSLRENGSEDSAIKAKSHQVERKDVDGSAEGVKVTDLVKMEWDEEEISLANSQICGENDNEGQIFGIEDGNNDDDDPDYIKSEEEPEDDDDQSEYEMEFNDDEDNCNADIVQEKVPLRKARKEKHSSAKKWANQFTSSEQQEANQYNVNNKFPCTCGKRFANGRSRADHIRRNKELHPEYEIYGDVKGHLRQTCDLCGEKIRLFDILQHLREDHFNGEAEWVIKCPNEKCRYMFASRNGVQLHLMKRGGGGINKECGKIWKDLGGPLCEICGFKGVNMLKIRNHVRDRHENKREDRKLRCPISGCLNMFCTKQGVSFHMDEHRYRLITHQGCDKCGENLKVEEMEGHLKEEHGIEEVIGCKQCGMKFSGREEMVEHLYEHRRIGINCDICGENKFARYVDFRQHYFGVHKLCPKKYKCAGEGTCDLWFWRKETKEDHELKMHSEADAGAQSKKLSVWETEKEKKTFKCDVCNVKFVVEDNLISHNIKMHGADPFSCDICGEIFHVKRVFNKHKKEHAGVVFQKEWKCEVEGCGKIFKEKRNWKHHVEVGHGGEKKHVCEICGKEFTFAASLRKHRDTVHLGLRLYVCEQCGEGFSGSSTLKRHKLIHTGERPFGCEICGQRFRHKEVLATHVRGHEKKGAEFKPNGPMKKIRKRKAQ